MIIEKIYEKELNHLLKFNQCRKIKITLKNANLVQFKKYQIKIKVFFNLIINKGSLVLVKKVQIVKHFFSNLTDFWMFH